MEYISFNKSNEITNDIENLYKLIYEKKDQDSDGDNDFADVRIARLIASGVSKEEAIRRVRNKPYNEDVNLDEAAPRVAKKIKGAKDPAAYQAGRSLAGKRISGDEKSGPAAYTSRMYAKDSPVAPGSRPNPPKVTKSELNYARTYHNDVKSKPWAKFGGPKGLPNRNDVKESNNTYDLIIEYLCDNGYSNNVESASAMIDHMSDEWLANILEAFVDPEQGEAPSGRSPIENVSYHPRKSVRKKAMRAFAKQMSKEYGGNWKAKSEDPNEED
jgi:hypothetical protein